MQRLIAGGGECPPVFPYLKSFQPQTDNNRVESVSHAASKPWRRNAAAACVQAQPRWPARSCPIVWPVCSAGERRDLAEAAAAACTHLAYCTHPCPRSVPASSMAAAGSSRTKVPQCQVRACQRAEVMSRCMARLC